MPPGRGLPLIRCWFYLCARGHARGRAPPGSLAGRGREAPANEARARDPELVGKRVRERELLPRAVRPAVDDARLRLAVAVGDDDARAARKDRVRDAAGRAPKLDAAFGRPPVEA